MNDIKIEPATDDDLRAMLAAVSIGHPLSLRESGKLIARLAAMQELVEAERTRADTAQKAGMERAALICEHYTDCFESARAKSVTQTCADAIRAAAKDQS